MLVVILPACGVAVHVFAAGSAGLEIPEQTAVAEDNLAPIAAVESNEPDLSTLDVAELDEPNAVRIAARLIAKGAFDEAGRLIEQYIAAGSGSFHLSELAELAEQYNRIVERRTAERQKAYEERIGELEKLRSGSAAEVNDTNQAADPNDYSAVLAVAARAISFADEKQKQQLLADVFVRQAIEQAKAKAAEFEAKGKWIDSYLACYSWLAAIEPDNEQYTDHAENLIEKADIAGSFEDSPCETSKERFEGVKKRMFVRAIDALNFNYVTKVDYRRMALKGVRRCKSLAEVVTTKLSVADGNSLAVSLGDSFEDFSPPGPNAVSALSSRLGGLLEETQQWPEGANKDKFLRVFDDVLAFNRTTANLPEQVLIAQFANAAFGALDPYTVIVWPKQVEDFEKLMTNEFSGIGVEITKEQGRLTVASLLPGTPAYASGLDARDIIEGVDGMPTKEMSLRCAVKHITGPPGTDVTLTISRPGTDERRQITITRATISVPTIRGWQRTTEGEWLYMIDDAEKIAYVRITNFSEKTADDLENVLAKLEAEGIRGLVLDLRYNSGGFLESAIDVSDKFLSGDMVVWTQPRFGIPTYVMAHARGTHPDYPMVILINAGSASASEIVAGALADEKHQRAVLVGERTHGKGVVQGITHYPGDGSQLKYTMAYYHLPSGQMVRSREEMEKLDRKDWGVGPDIEIKMRGDELRKMFDVQRDNDVLVKAGHDNTAAPLTRHTLEETVEVDPQLAVALLVVRAKLILQQAEELKRKAA